MSQIYSFDVAGNSNELVRYWGERSRSRDHRWLIVTLKGVFSPISGLHGLNLMKQYSYSLPAWWGGPDGIEVW